MADRILDPGTGCYIREISGRSGSDTPGTDTFQRKFHVYDNADPLIARQALLNQNVALSLDEFAGLFLDQLSWSLAAGHQRWEFTADYSWTPKPGEYTITMDTTGGVVTATEAFAANRFPAPGEVSPDFGTSINVQNDGTITGTERVIPALKLTVNARMTATYVSDAMAYAKACSALTGYMNSLVYLTHQPGELLYLGASGEIVGENPIIQHQFLSSPNLTNWTIGPITGINKLGHDYIWFQYKPQKDATSGLKVAKVRCAYVDRIYGQADFDPLKIGEI